MSPKGFVVVYTPSEGMEDMVEKVSSRKELIVVGDFNVRFGVHSKIIGRYGEDKYNDNGDKLIVMCVTVPLKFHMAFITTHKQRLDSTSAPTLNKIKHQI